MNSLSLRVLMVIPSLPVGGAEWAFVRLANALAPSHEVTVYVPWAADSSADLLGAFDDRVRRVSLPLPWSWMHRLVYKLTLLFPRINLERRLHRWTLGLLHRLERFQIVNAHLHGGARLACDAFRHQEVPVVETDHGDYALLQKQDPSLVSHQEVFARLDGMICPSRANAARVQGLPWKPGFAQAVIPYAVPAASGGAAPSSGSFTFGLLARGVAEKGWAEALEAYRLLRRQVKVETKLLFIGDGPEIQRLRAEVRPDEGVEFAGYQADTSAWTARCDVGLLPSYFTAESLPNAIIEFQAQGRPVIATAVGGIPEMLEGSGKVIALDPVTGRADVAALAGAMRQMLEDASWRQSCADSARVAFQRYAPSRIAEAYGAFFTSLIPHG